MWTEKKKKKNVDREPYLVTLCLTSVFNISLLLSEMTMQKTPTDARRVRIRNHLQFKFNARNVEPQKYKYIYMIIQ